MRLVTYENSFAYKCPDLIREWHPTRNGDLTPDVVSFSSRIVVWWFLSYDDPITGKHFDLVWDDNVAHRSQGRGCPYLSGRRLLVGFNDLMSRYPDVAKQWHPVKNGDLTPEDVTYACNRDVWWYDEYVDDNGQKFCFEWKARVSNRTLNGRGNPFLAGKQVWKGFNDLASVCPALIDEWDFDRNGGLKPDEIYCHSTKKVWWHQCCFDDELNEWFDFYWEASPFVRIVEGRGNPYLVNQRILVGYNDLATRRPDVALMWHPAKNKKMTPYDVTYRSSYVVWWLQHYYDERTQRWFDFEWRARVADVVMDGYKNPYLSSKQIWRGYNDLESNYPELAKEWHPVKNGKLKPWQIHFGTERKVWWQQVVWSSAEDRFIAYEWKASVTNRVHGCGNPYLMRSHGEDWIADYLVERGYSFEQSKKFLDLLGVGGRCLSYDFYVESLNLLIEYQGEQHYKACSYFGGERRLRIQREHDRRKRNYARKHSIRLIEVSYRYDAYDKIVGYLDSVLF